jgi:single-strand DNA-binding protein
MPARIGLRLRRASAANVPMTTLLWRVSAVMYPVLCLVTASGFFPAPGGTRSSASPSAPLRGLGSSQNKFANDGTKRRANFFRAPPRKQTFGLGSRTHSLGFAQCDPSNNGKFNKRRHDYVPEQSNPHRLCRQQPRSSHTNDNRSLTTLSLATKSSYKKDGKYISHTEWHRCVVFGKLAEFAKTLTKGAHIQVEGELRSREYDSKKTDAKARVWEIRVASILKLDRAEKAGPEDAGAR